MTNDDKSQIVKQMFTNRTNSDKQMFQMLTNRTNGMTNVDKQDKW